MKIIITTIVFVLILTCAFIFGMSNNQTVNFDYLIATSELKLSTLTWILLTSGFVIGWIFTGYFYLKLKIKFSSINSKNKKLQKNLDELMTENKKNNLLEIN